MYVKNSNITLPENPDTIVWKYLDLSKFLDLLISKKLFLSRSDKFEDQYEGTFSEPTFEEIKKLSENNPAFLDYYKSHREKVVVSSWHINEYESFAMWQIFTQNSEGLAIQSTLGRIQSALEYEKDIKQYIGEVNYIDYKKEYIPFDDMFFPFLFKRKSFQYEREVRIIADLSDQQIKINDGIKLMSTCLNSSKKFIFILNRRIGIKNWSLNSFRNSDLILKSKNQIWKVIF